MVADQALAAGGIPVFLRLSAAEENIPQAPLTVVNTDAL